MYSGEARDYSLSGTVTSRPAPEPSYMGFTRAHLLSVFRLDETTGALVWLVGRNKGQRAGSINGAGYWHVNLRGKWPRQHKLVWLMVHNEVPEEIDHENLDATDNRPSNLRASTRVQNAANRTCSFRNNTSGYKGVSWHSKTGKWRACIGIDNKMKHIGVFDCRHDAARAYNAKAVEVFGTFAKLNVIVE